MTAVKLISKRQFIYRNALPLHPCNRVGFAHPRDKVAAAATTNCPPAQTEPNNKDADTLNHSATLTELGAKPQLW